MKPDKNRNPEILYKVEDEIAYITLNRPKQMNALNISMCTKLQNVIRKCADDKIVRVVILTGAGDVFCAGGDVKEMRRFLTDPEQGKAKHFIDELNNAFNKVILSLRNFPKPVIGAINGICSGGGAGIAFACDILIANPKAQIHIPNARIGLVPDGGNSFFLVQKMGLNRAAELCFTSGSINAEEAHKIGIFNRVVTSEEVLPTAVSLARNIAKGPLFALELSKIILNQALSGNLESQLKAEREAVVKCAAKEDFKEGIMAFFEKRKPNFNNSK